jgi:methylenetetrahydrofolate--tRNA-(uracil-5-)-methyltransferase
MLAGINLARLLGGDEPVLPPPTTMLGALYRYLREADPAHFQPMNANFGLLEPLEKDVKDKAKRRDLLVERALAEMDMFASKVGVTSPPGPLSANAERGNVAGDVVPPLHNVERGSGGEV